MKSLQTKIPPDLESVVQKSVIARLEFRFGIKLWRRNVGAMHEGERFIRFAEPGQSDLWGVYCGRHWEIETKRFGMRPNPEQLRWLKDMTRRNCVAFWVDSADIAERVSEAIIEGGRIEWLEDDSFNVIQGASTPGG